MNELMNELAVLVKAARVAIRSLARHGSCVLYRDGSCNA
jgi:hypothetical protein